MIANRNAAEPDIVLVGAGIMSATLGTVLKELEPTLNIVLFETLHDGYTGKGVGTTGTFFQGVDIAGNPRTSFGGYLQSAYTFGRATVGGSYGVSYLDTANAFDTANVTTLRLAGTGCLVHKNESWIGFVRYKLTSWVNLQAEYIHTRDQNTIGQSNNDDAVVAGTTFFW